MAQTGTVKLKTERLTLRKMRFTDMPAARKWYCDKRVTFFSQGKEKKGLPELISFFSRRIYNYYFKRKNHYYWWAICKDKHMIGFIGLLEIPDSDAFSLYYMLSPDEWNNGYVKEAVRSVCDYMKTQETPYLLISCDSENIASVHIAKACGFNHIQTKKNYFHYRDGRSGNCEKYVLRF